MIETSLLVERFGVIEPCDDLSVLESVIPPLQRIKSFSPDEFEEFVSEWAISCAKTRYKDVYRIGGSGDKGRDVIGEYEDGGFDYYQCKRYGGKLAPSQFWIEFGKLCYFVYSQDIPMPKKYYIIASQGIGSSLLRLIKSPEEIRAGLKKEWDSKCRNDIVKGEKIELTGSFAKFVDEFDFSIVDTYSIEKIIEEHRHTNYFYFRFGGQIKPRRKIVIQPPTNFDANELIYIQKLLEVYSDYVGKETDITELEKYTKLYKDFCRHRFSFYSAESLKRNIRDIFTNENEFNKLKDEMLSGIISYTLDNFENNFSKLCKVSHESTKVNLSISIVDRELNFVCNDDKKGLCQHLANDGEIDWGDAI